MYPSIINIQKEQKITKNTITTIYNNFKTKENEKHYKNCLKKLENYCYVNNNYKLWDGRQVRYIDTSNPLDMPLKLGGFVLHDNGYTVHIKNKYRSFKVSKQGKLFFMYINSQDQIRSLVHSQLS